MSREKVTLDRDLNDQIAENSRWAWEEAQKEMEQADSGQKKKGSDDVQIRP